MIKVDLITGFLGSGKTTFMKKYVQHLVNSGKNTGIIENDHGAVNVDLMLLQELFGPLCDMEMVTGGDGYETHIRRLKAKLIAFGMRRVDRVVIEPSGVFDVDEFFDVLYEEPLDRWYEVGNVIVVVDAKLEDDLSEQSDYLLASQLANAGRIILSRTQDATDKDIEHTVRHINEVMEKFGCSRRFDKEIVTKPWDEFTDKDFEDIESCGYVLESHVKLPVSQENSFESLYFMNYHMSEVELREKSAAMMQDEACGNVFRIKGFMPVENGWIEINATHREINIKPIEKGQEIVIVIGEDLVEERVREYFEAAGK